MNFYLGLEVLIIKSIKIMVFCRRVTCPGEGGGNLNIHPCEGLTVLILNTPPKQQAGLGLQQPGTVLVTYCPADSICPMSAVLPMCCHPSTPETARGIHFIKLTRVDRDTPGLNIPAKVTPPD
jgi:hypothetical protein